MAGFRQTPAPRCIFVKSRRTGESVSTPFGVRPRRINSSTVAACIKSNSPSLKCLTALRRSLGSTYRRGSLSVVALGAGDAEAVAVGNRSGAVRSAGSRPMAANRRERYWLAINSERSCTPSSKPRSRFQRPIRSFLQKFLAVFVVHKQCEVIRCLEFLTKCPMVALARHFPYQFGERWMGLAII
jgi:hypothetical protein